jgi:alpha-tubulin suppressor-like RCC1 family protein
MWRWYQVTTFAFLHFCIFNRSLTRFIEFQRTNVFTPLRIRGLRNIIQVAAGQTHSMALDSQNNVWVYEITDNNKFLSNKNSNQERKKS